MNAQKFSHPGSVLLVAVLGSALLTFANHGQITIQSFDTNGELSWDDPQGTGSHYAVQWASSPEGPWLSWEDAVERLSSLGPTGVASVPLFYRVVNPDPQYRATETYSYFQSLPEFDPLTPLQEDEMRISFLGSTIPPPRRAQAEMSIFVEVGWIPDPSDPVYGGRARDQFVFDCGSGVSGNYNAMKIGFRRMDKVFINHLHADHMTDLCHIYAFGPSGDRKSPLYVFGPGPSGVESPEGSGIFYEDGTKKFCENLRKALRWHSESFAFQSSSYASFDPPTQESWGLPVIPLPVEDDSANDANAIIPIELDWTRSGVQPDDNIAYHNSETGVKISHFPVIHCRKGAIGYKLEWNDMSMIYTSDTKPETNSVHQACNGGKGVDVFIHEMIVPPEVWALKSMGLEESPAETDPIYETFQRTVHAATSIQNSSHTPQGAFGYIMSQIDPPPRLTVATHFPVADDTIASALESVRAHCPDVRMGDDLTWSFDLMVLRVFPDRIEQVRAVVSDFGYYPPAQAPDDPNPPKYRDENGNWDPFAQIDLSTEIPAVNDDGTVNYREDGF